MENNKCFESVNKEIIHFELPGGDLQVYFDPVPDMGKAQWIESMTGFIEQVDAYDDNEGVKATARSCNSIIQDLYVQRTRSIIAERKKRKIQELVEEVKSKKAKLDEEQAEWDAKLKAFYKGLEEEEREEEQAAATYNFHVNQLIYELMEISELTPDTLKKKIQAYSPSIELIKETETALEKVRHKKRKRSLRASAKSCPNKIL